MSDLMKLTKAQLIELLLKNEKDLTTLKSQKEGKVIRKKYPIEPICPFPKMGKLEYHRWRVNYLSYEIENNMDARPLKYVNQEKRNRVYEMKQFIHWYEILIKESHKEAEPFKDLYNEYTGFIGPADKRLAVKEVKLNRSEK